MTQGPANSIGLARTLIPLSIAVVGVGWKLLSSGTTSQSTITKKDPQSEQSEPGDFPPAPEALRIPGTLPPIHRHHTYWFDDGSVIVRASSDLRDTQAGNMYFKIHKSLLHRHSNFARLAVLESEHSRSIPMMTIPPELGVQVQDFISLLGHLYHDTPLSPEAPFQHVAAILRVSSPNQLDLPSVHSLAKSCFEAMFPSGPYAFVHGNHLEEALSLAVSYNITSIQKGLYYSLVMTTDFEPDMGVSQSENPVASSTLGDEGVSVDLSARHILSPADIERCRKLMAEIVEFFVPVVFTAPATPHMVCTDIFADKWMQLVIQSAIEDGSLYKPLEMLEQLKQIDWEAEGLCPTCVQEKRGEWTEQQEGLWEMMDGWLGLSTEE
ncbi:hypothetical protein PAXRUDRAFT_830477 [Paxillus rubicundulus Ve08.2h10]|uniref:BTB domain-containing protein n=1 Tax=Paxillus rubicundulus Ve08.2h10 TaxID=930991 RepID=A0A0D0DTH2_9AGAM|nr:hypothetical protein PAXRUDRAFT_830477 [Paxillus rubicundulus Ve08.2h10]